MRKIFRLGNLCIDLGWYAGEPCKMLELQLFEYLPELALQIVIIQVARFGFSIVWEF